MCAAGILQNFHSSVFSTLGRFEIHLELFIYVQNHCAAAIGN